MLVGFARVSTIEQDLSIQLSRLSEAGCEKIFEGKNSGKKEGNAARLEELQKYVREGDVVVVTKLDRLGRSLSQILRVLEDFKERGVGFRSLDDGIDTTQTNSPMTTALIQLLGTFAELERNLIVSRTIEGKRAKGMLQGRPEKLSQEQYKNFKKDVNRGLSLSELQKKYLMGRATVSRWKKKVKAEK